MAKWNHGAAIIGPVAQYLTYIEHFLCTHHHRFHSSSIVSKMTKSTVTASSNSEPSIMEKVQMMLKKVHQKSYCKYNTAYLFDSLIKFACCTDGISICTYLKTKEKILNSSFLTYFKQSGLAELKSNGPFDIAVAKMMLTNFFDCTTKNCSKRIVEAHASCCYLMDNKEHSLV